MEMLLAANLLAPNAGLIFWITVTFLLLLFVLSRYAWKPILTSLGEREQTIEDSIQRAEKALAEARLIQADNEKARREAEQEAARILRGAREQSERLFAEEKERTEARMQALKDQAEADIARMHEDLRRQMRSEVTAIAIQASEKILRENLDTDRQSKLVDRVIDDMGRN